MHDWNGYEIDCTDGAHVETAGVRVVSFRVSAEDRLDSAPIERIQAKGGRRIESPGDVTCLI